MYGPGLAPFNDGYAIASIDLPTEYKVILLTSVGTKGASPRFGTGGNLG
jgi:hypothetical protein